MPQGPALLASTACGRPAPGIAAAAHLTLAAAAFAALRCMRVQRAEAAQRTLARGARAAAGRGGFRLVQLPIPAIRVAACGVAAAGRGAGRVARGGGWLGCRWHQRGCRHPLQRLHAACRSQAGGHRASAPCSGARVQGVWPLAPPLLGGHPDCMGVNPRRLSRLLARFRAALLSNTCIAWVRSSLAIDCSRGRWFPLSKRRPQTLSGASIASTTTAYQVHYRVPCAHGCDRGVLMRVRDSLNAKATAGRCRGVVDWAVSRAVRPP